MTSHPYRPLRIPACADLDVLAAAQSAHRDAQALRCPQCRAEPGCPCHGTGGIRGHGYSHVARRAALAAQAGVPSVTRRLVSPPPGATVSAGAPAGALAVVPLLAGRPREGG